MEYIIQTTILTSPWNKNLDASNFMLSSDTPNRLHDLYGIWLVLFYGEDNKSIEFLKVWSKISHNIVGPDFGSCNLRLHKDIANRIFNDKNNSVVDRTLPYIACYSDTWKIAEYYNTPDGIDKWIMSVLKLSSIDTTNKMDREDNRPIDLPQTL